ncbi:MAG: trypsin-like peptidase domain-containing protein [Magnetococcales bacterium]|nr:trypsin-like peptidase domain-containing protein [Magnetococcales bacterium]
MTHVFLIQTRHPENPTPSKRGSAWFIAPGRVITAYHIVGEQNYWYQLNGYRYYLQFSDRELELTPLLFDSDADVACLEIEKSQIDTSQMVLNLAKFLEPSSEMNWWMLGFPEFNGTDSFNIKGTVQYVHPGSHKKALQLETNLKPHDPAVNKWSGMSGAPVILNENSLVIGVLTMEIATYQTLWACPLLPLLYMKDEIEGFFPIRSECCNWLGEFLSDLSHPPEELHRFLEFGRPGDLLEQLEGLKRSRPDLEDRVRLWIEQIEPFTLQAFLDRCAASSPEGETAGRSLPTLDLRSTFPTSEESTASATFSVLPQPRDYFWLPRPPWKRALATLRRENAIILVSPSGYGKTMMLNKMIRRIRRHAGQCRVWEYGRRLFDEKAWENEALFFADLAGHMGEKILGYHDWSHAKALILNGAKNTVNNFKDFLKTVLSSVGTDGVLLVFDHAEELLDRSFRRSIFDNLLHFGFNTEPPFDRLFVILSFSPTVITSENINEIQGQAKRWSSSVVLLVDPLSQKELPVLIRNLGIDSEPSDLEAFHFLLGGHPGWSRKLLEQCRERENLRSLTSRIKEEKLYKPIMQQVRDLLVGKHGEKLFHLLLSFIRKPGRKDFSLNDASILTDLGLLSWKGGHLGYVPSAGILSELDHRDSSPASPRWVS